MGYLYSEIQSLPIEVQINKENLARINACGISLTQLYLKDYEKNQQNRFDDFVLNIDRKPKVKNTKVSDDNRLNARQEIIISDTKPEITEDKTETACEKTVKRYNKSKSKPHNAIDEVENKLRAEETAQKNFNRYRKFLPAYYSEEEQKQIIKEAYRIMLGIKDIGIEMQVIGKKRPLIN